MKPTSKRVTREVGHGSGAVVDYGPLMYGIIGGIKVLAPKEVLIAFRIQLLPGKVGEFVTHSRYKVTMEHRKLTAYFYVTKFTDIEDAARVLGRMGGHLERELLITQYDGGYHWQQTTPFVDVSKRENKAGTVIDNVVNLPWFGQRVLTWFAKLIS